MKRVLRSTVIVAGLLFVTACSNEEVDKVVEEEKVEEVTPVALAEEVLKWYLDALYFSKDVSYDDFIALYESPEAAPSEQTFNDFREVTDPRNTFITSDINEVLENVTYKEVDEQTIQAYWGRTEDVTYEKAKEKWTFVLIEDEWKLQ